MGLRQASTIRLRKASSIAAKKAKWHAAKKGKWHAAEKSKWHAEEAGKWHAAEAAVASGTYMAETGKWQRQGSSMRHAEADKWHVAETGKWFATEAAKWYICSREHESPLVGHGKLASIFLARVYPLAWGRNANLVNFVMAGCT